MGHTSRLVGTLQLACRLALVPLVLGGVAACGKEEADLPLWSELPDDNQEYFTGRVYNGVSLERLSDYKMTLEYFDRTIDAQVDKSGRYLVGPLLPNADYTIAIEQDNFRSFLSHNAMLAAAPTAGTRSRYFEAFLYPDSVQAPAEHVRFSLANETTVPSGTVRFAPRSASALFDETDETPAGVARQVWGNDEDLQQRTIVRDFQDGVLDVDAGEFVLGVEYAVTVYGVENHAILTGGSFTAGVDGNPSFTLTPVSISPLSVVAVSTTTAELSPTGTVEIMFNHEVKAYPRMDETAATRSLNDALVINSPDLDKDGERNRLNDAAMLTPPIDATYRGVTWEVQGQKLILSWNYESGLRTADDGDPIVSITYGNLGAIRLYTGIPTAPEILLSDLLGQASLTVQMVGQ